MESHRRLFLAPILTFLTLSVAIQNPVPMFISEIDTFLDTEHKEEKASSVFECVKRCLSTFGCKSINYKKSSREDNCFLNKMNRREAGEAAIKIDKEFVHYDLSYHIQRSEETEFGTTDNMPTVPPVVQGPCHFGPCENGGTCIEIASNRTYKCQCGDNFYGKKCRQIVTYCDANPCKNGGTCVQALSAKTYTCNCTDSFTGKNCSQSIAEEQSKGDDAAPTVASLEKGTGQPQSQDDYDFELVFRKTQRMSYVKQDINGNTWVQHFTVCAWIHTPDIQQNQNMTVISILTEKGGNRKILRVRIDGEGKIYFSIGDDQTTLSDVFATSSPKDQLVFLCVRIQTNQSPYIEAIINADFSSKKSSDGVRNDKVLWTQVVIGQNQDIDGTVTADYPFYGRISNLNIWFGSLSEENIRNWNNSGEKYHKPGILIWPALGSSSKRIGDVHFVKVTSAERQWRDVSEGDVYVESTTNILITKTVESGSGVVIKVERQSPLHCTEIDPIDSATVDGVFISVPGSWKRIRYKQTFLETQKCFAIFGSVPNWATDIYSPGVSEFRLDLDELWKEEYLRPDGNHFDGVNALCGNEHFWMVNRPNTPVAGVSLRRKGSGSRAGISTFGKCGKFKFKISDIRVLE